VRVDSAPAEYDATLPAWLRARDVLAGEAAVKAAGENYLPRLDSQSEPGEYFAGERDIGDQEPLTMDQSRKQKFEIWPESLFENSSCVLALTHSHSFDFA